MIYSQVNKNLNSDTNKMSGVVLSGEFACNGLTNMFGPWLSEQVTWRMKKISFKMCSYRKVKAKKVMTNVAFLL